MKIMKISENGFIEIKNINAELESYQKEVGGLIDFIRISENIDLIVNDEFLLNGSEPSLYINHNLIVHGNCFFAKEGGLDKEDLNYLYRRLRKIKVLDINIIVLVEE